MFAISSRCQDIDMECLNVETYVWLVFWELEHSSGTSDIALAGKHLKIMG
jgi:hypothetical protein